MRIGWDKSGVFVKKAQTGWTAFLCDLPIGVLVPVWQSKEGDIHLVVSKDRVGVISPNSTIVQTTRPLNGQRRSINPTSWCGSHQES